MLQDTVYHSLLRIASLSLALVLLFESGTLNHATKELSDNTRQYLASAIGIQASVTPNELNLITSELTSRQRELDEREAALKEREIAVDLGDEAGGTTLSTFILASLLFILLVLILLNYVLDYLRRPVIYANTRST